MRDACWNLRYLLVLIVAVSPLRAGSLEPPGPPAPTMKTLDQIQAIPVESLSGWPTATYVISEPGSYYLTRNLLAEPGKNGIQTSPASPSRAVRLLAYWNPVPQCSPARVGPIDVRPCDHALPPARVAVCQR